MDAIWWQIFDLLGTTAFAVSGVFVAISRRMDLFGIFVLSAATAVGGGIIRDILIGNIPPAAQDCRRRRRPRGRQRAHYR